MAPRADEMQRPAADSGIVDPSGSGWIPFLDKAACVAALRRASESWTSDQGVPCVRPSAQSPLHSFSRGPWILTPSQLLLSSCHAIGNVDLIGGRGWIGPANPERASSAGQAGDPGLHFAETMGDRTNETACVPRRAGPSPLGKPDGPRLVAVLQLIENGLLCWSGWGGGIGR